MSGRCGYSDSACRCFDSLSILVSVVLFLFCFGLSQLAWWGTAFFPFQYADSCVLLLGLAWLTYAVTVMFRCSPMRGWALTSVGVCVLPNFCVALLEGALGLVRYRP